MNNIDNKRKYLEFIDQKEAYENKAKDRFRELFLAVYQVIFPFVNQNNIDEKKMFPNATKFDKHTCAKLHKLFYGNDHICVNEIEFHGDGYVCVNEIEKKCISFNYNVEPYNDESSYFLVDTILAYGSDEEFNTYLNTIVEECKAFTQYLKDKEVSEQKAKTEQDYQRYLKLKAQFEGKR